MATKKLQILGGLPKPDWDETDETSLSYIRNKPEITTDDDAIDLLMEYQFINPLASSDNSIYLSSTNKIYII